MFLIPSAPNLNSEGNRDHFTHGFEDFGRLLHILHHRGTTACFGNFRDRTTHVQVDDICPSVLQPLGPRDKCLNIGP